MPRVDGFEVLKTIKGDEHLKSTPIIVLTNSQNDQDIQRAYTLGANSYIIKPNNFQEFVDAIKEIKQYWLDTTKIPNN